LSSASAQVSRSTIAKTYGFSVRCLKDWDLFLMTTEDIFQAYYDARKHKRNSNSALSFEMDYESNLFALYDDIQNGRYSIGKSTCFISFKPVQREVFAADFRDRVVHHVIYNYIASVFERLFINDCYSCRVGRGTAYGIARVDHFIRSCSANYSRDCYILKLDIRGYFMSIDKQLLYGKLEKDIRRYSASINTDVDALLRLIRQTVFHDSTKHCQIRGGG
jgi:RNA-directed DNA polymerase